MQLLSVVTDLCRGWHFGGIAVMLLQVHKHSSLLLTQTNSFFGLSLVTYPCQVTKCLDGSDFASHVTYVEVSCGSVLSFMECGKLLKHPRHLQEPEAQET